MSQISINLNSKLDQKGFNDLNKAIAQSQNKLKTMSGGVGAGAASQKGMQQSFDGANKSAQALKQTMMSLMPMMGLNGGLVSGIGGMAAQFYLANRAAKSLQQTVDKIGGDKSKTINKFSSGKSFDVSSFGRKIADKYPSSFAGQSLQQEIKTSDAALKGYSLRRGYSQRKMGADIMPDRHSGQMVLPAGYTLAGNVGGMTGAGVAGAAVAGGVAIAALGVAMVDLIAGTNNLGTAFKQVNKAATSAMNALGRGLNYLGGADSGEEIVKRRKNVMEGMAETLTPEMAEMMIKQRQQKLKSVEELSKAGLGAGSYWSDTTPEEIEQIKQEIKDLASGKMTGGSISQLKAEQLKDQLEFRGRKLAEIGGTSPAGELATLKEQMLKADVAENVFVFQSLKKKVDDLSVTLTAYDDRVKELDDATKELKEAAEKRAEEMNAASLKAAIEKDERYLFLRGKDAEKIAVPEIQTDKSSNIMTDSMRAIGGAFNLPGNPLLSINMSIKAAVERSATALEKMVSGDGPASTRDIPDVFTSFNKA